jgi:hypothetical protein
MGDAKYKALILQLSMAVARADLSRDYVIMLDKSVLGSRQKRDFPI